jgi:Flp pilus assembly protein TadB
MRNITQEAAFHQELERSRRERQKELAARDERRRLGIPEPKATAGDVLGRIVFFLVFAAIVAAVVVGAILLIRYGYARHWWW